MKNTSEHIDFEPMNSKDINSEHTNIAGLLKYSHFPPPYFADKNGILAVGGNLGVEWLLDAYIHGIFPWPINDPTVPLLWFCPHERALIEPETFHISRRLRQTLRSGKFTVTIDKCFRDVIQNCASVERPEEDGTWITPDIVEAFCAFHEAGFAHSVEVWRGERLVGGLYGEAIGSYFAGESKFHFETDASKVALAWIVRHLQTLGFTLIDVQVANSHTEQFHLNIVPQAEFLSRLHKAVISKKVRFSSEFAWKKEDF